MIPPKIALIIPRLATDHVGELVAARDALVRSLSAAGLDLHDLAAACTGPLQTEIRSTPNPPSFGDLARATRDLDRGQLSTKERAFVFDMCARGFAFRPSPRQSAWLDDILYRLQRKAAA